MLEALDQHGRSLGLSEDCRSLLVDADGGVNLQRALAFDGVANCVVMSIKIVVDGAEVGEVPLAYPVRAADRFVLAHCWISR